MGTLTCPTRAYAPRKLTPFASVDHVVAQPPPSTTPNNYYKPDECRRRHRPRVPPPGLHLPPRRGHRGPRGVHGGPRAPRPRPAPQRLRGEDDPPARRRVRPRYPQQGKGAEAREEAADPDRDLGGPGEGETGEEGGAQGGQGGQEGGAPRSRGVRPHRRQQEVDEERTQEARVG